VKDVWGDQWRVLERRPTSHGFAIYLGRSDSAEARGGKPAVIVTTPLATHFRENLQRPNVHKLPIGDNARRRIRQALGVDHRAWTDIRLAWWYDRIEDLATLSARAFVARHRGSAWTRKGTLSTTLVCRMRLSILGRQRRPRGWWTSPTVQALVTSSLPVHVIAERLGLSPWTVYGVRDRIKRSRKGGGRQTDRAVPLVTVVDRAGTSTRKRRGTRSTVDVGRDLGALID